MSGPDGPLSLEEAAGLVGAYCAIERTLFELTGAAAARPEAAPAAAVLLSSWSAEHAWHAELWADRLPVTAAIDPGALVALPAPLPEVLDQLASAEPVSQLSGLVRVVLPRLVVTYDRHLALSSAVSDGPTRRALTLVARDEREEREAGEALLEELLCDEATVGTAGQGAVELERNLVRGGLRAGFVRWPGQRA